MTTPATTEIAVRDNGVIAERDVVDGWLETVVQVSKLAGIVAPTDFVPEAYRNNPAAVTAAILTGRELGVGPMTALRHVQLVKGTATLSAEYKRARVLAAGHDFDIIELNTERCRVSGRRKGSDKAPLEVTFTMADAKKAGLIRDRGPWITRPRRMLFARAGSELCDFLFADVVNGLPTAELVADGVQDDEYAGYDEPPAGPSTRTAQRKTRTPATQPSPPENSPAAPQDTPVTGVTLTSPPEAEHPVTGHQGPPLPGEDENLDYDTPGTVTKEQLTALWATFSQDLGFTTADKAEARHTVEQLLGRQMDGGTTADLSRNEASAVIDTLKRCKTRGNLVALLASGEVPEPA